MPIAISTMPAVTDRCAPIALATRSDSTEPATRHSAIGTNASPASVGENPSTFCR